MNDLIERYIYAATRRLPHKQQADVAQELRGLVDDMLAERCGAATPTEKDVRVVLTELGTPQDLYMQYDTDAKKCLIGQPYYTTYIFVLKIVMAAVAGGITLTNILLRLIEPAAPLEAVLTWLGMLYNCALAAFTITTLIFAFFYRKGVKLSEPWSFDDLPPVPKRKQQISRAECIAGIVFCGVFAVLTLCVPQVLGAISSRTGRWIAIFDIEALRGTWYIIAAFAACGILRESVQLFEGRWNKRVLIVTLTANVVSAALAVWWLVGFDLMSADFLSSINAIFESSGEIVITLFENLQIFLLLVILFALGIDSVEAAVKTLRK